MSHVAWMVARMLAFSDDGGPFLGSALLFCVLLGILLVFVSNVRKGMQEETWKDRRKSGRCLNCDYKLRGNLSGVCPECGTPATAVPPNAIPKDQPAPFLLSSWAGGRPLTPADLLEESRRLAERNAGLSRDNVRLEEEVARLAFEFQDMHARAEAMGAEVSRLRYTAADVRVKACEDCDAPIPAGASFCPRCGRKQQQGRVA